jgi:NADPH-dependent F420 reductase
MQIAILGGTGDIGTGLALRWGQHTDHTINIGSRSAERGEEAAADYAEQVPQGDYRGGENDAVTEGADVVVLAVPPYHVESTIDAVSDAFAEDAIVLTPAVGLKKTDTGMKYHAPPAGSVTQLVADTVPEHVRVVGSLHNVPAAPLADLDVRLDLDTPLVADDADAEETIIDLIGTIPGIDPIRAGPIANASEAECIVALLLNMEQYGTRADALSMRLTPAAK